MKHIKEYNTYSKMEELSDYLQEMFDMFGIVQASEKQEEEPISYWELFENKIYISIIKKDSWLYNEYDFDRRKIDPPDVDEIGKYFDKIKENLEKRLGCKIHIDIKSNPDSTTLIINL